MGVADELNVDKFPMSLFFLECSCEATNEIRARRSSDKFARISNRLIIMSSGTGP